MIVTINKLCEYLTQLKYGEFKNAVLPLRYYYCNTKSTIKNASILFPYEKNRMINFDKFINVIICGEKKDK